MGLPEPSEPNALLGDLGELPPGLAGRARRAAAFAASEVADRRGRVLKHPDLAAKLTKPPLNYKRPEQWNGYVPPRTDAEDECPGCPDRCRGVAHLAAANTSPWRRALIEICHEALQREQETAEG